VELNHDFTVSVPIDEAFAVLTDLERIAPCMPGAQLQEVEGDEYRGVVKVKVGPITTQYRGAAHIAERDAAAHRAVLRAEGRETRGQGTAAATVTADLHSEPSGTSVHIRTDLEVTGKVAQFGRGVLAEVSEKLLGQFVQDLEQNVLLGSDLSGATPDGQSPATDQARATDQAPADGEVPPLDEEVTVEVTVIEGPERPVGVVPPLDEEVAVEVRVIEGPERPPVDLVQAAGGSILKRVGPVLVVLVIVVLRRRRRRRRR
jgi:carbon monoxide dehydrogenase subunit G